MFLGTWWDIMLGRSEEHDEWLEAKVRANKADMIIECEEVTFEGLLPCFDAAEGVTKFPFLVPEGLDEFSVEQSEWKVFT